MGRLHQAGDLEQPLSAGCYLLSTHLHEDLTLLTPAKLEGALCSGDVQPTSEARVELRRTQLPPEHGASGWFRGLAAVASRGSPRSSN